MLYNPALVAVSGMVIWLVVWLFSPLDVRFGLELNTVVFLTFCYASFFTGCFLARQARKTRTLSEATGRNVWTTGVNLKLFWSTYVIGLISMALRFYDRVAVRGIDYGADSAEIREALANTDFSGLSAIASIIMPFCFLPLILLLAGKWQRNYLPQLVFAIILFMLPALESVAQASRSVLLLTVALGFATISILRFGGRIFDRVLVVPALATLVGLAIISSTLFQQRLDDAGRQVEDSLETSAYAEALIPNRSAREAMADPESVRGQVIRNNLASSMYYLHGVYEMELLFNRPDEQFFGFGGYIFYPYSRVLALIFGQENVRGLDDSLIIYRPGVFTTFFGPIWVDFGWLSFLIMIGIGFLAEKSSQFVRRGYINALPVYLFLTVIIFYMPVFNFLTSGFGFFILHGFALFSIFASFQPRHELTFEQRSSMLG